MNAPLHSPPVRATAAAVMWRVVVDVRKRNPSTIERNGPATSMRLNLNISESATFLPQRAVSPHPLPGDGPVAIQAPQTGDSSATGHTSDTVHYWCPVGRPRPEKQRFALDCRCHARTWRFSLPLTNGWMRGFVVGVSDRNGSTTRDKGPTASRKILVEHRFRPSNENESH